MAFNSIPEYTTTAATNTDIGGVSIAEGFNAENINNSERQLLAQLKTECALGSVVASASTVDISKIHACRISGTTPITTFTITDGTTRWLTFAAACPITYDGTKMIIQGGVSVTMAAGDMAIVEGIGVNQARVFILRASGAPTIAVLTPAISEIGGLLPTSIAGTSTTATITITAGSAADSTNVRRLTLGSQAWAVANGNAINGYDGGSTLPNSSTIHFFICYGTTGTGTFASTSLTPTFPTGYTTYSRRIFSLTTTAAGALIGGVATELAGGACQLDFAATLSVLNGVAPTLSAISFALPTPLGVKVQGNVRITSTNPNNGGLGTLFTSLDQPDEAPGAIAGNQSFGSGNTTLGISQSGERSVMTDTSAQIRRRSNNTTGTLSLVCYGYTDARRT